MSIVSERRRSLLEIVQSDLPFLQALIELLLREGRFDLGQLGVDFLVRGQQAKLLGALHQDFVVDQIAQDLQAQRIGLLRARLLRRAGHLRVIELLHFGARDLAAIDHGHHVVADLFVGAAKAYQKRTHRQQAGHRSETYRSLQFQTPPLLRGTHPAAEYMARINPQIRPHYVSQSDTGLLLAASGLGLRRRFGRRRRWRRRFHARSLELTIQCQSQVGCIHRAFNFLTIDK